MWPLHTLLQSHGCPSNSLPSADSGTWLQDFIPIQRSQPVILGSEVWLVVCVPIWNGVDVKFFLTKPREPFLYGPGSVRWGVGNSPNCRHKAESTPSEILLYAEALKVHSTLHSSSTCRHLSACEDSLFHSDAICLISSWRPQIYPHECQDLRFPSRTLNGMRHSRCIMGTKGQDILPPLLLQCLPFFDKIFFKLDGSAQARLKVQKRPHRLAWHCSRMHLTKV